MLTLPILFPFFSQNPKKSMEALSNVRPRHPITWPTHCLPSWCTSLIEWRDKGLTLSRDEGVERGEMDVVGMDQMRNACQSKWSPGGPEWRSQREGLRGGGGAPLTRPSTQQLGRYSTTLGKISKRRVERLKLARSEMVSFIRFFFCYWFAVEHWSSGAELHLWYLFKKFDSADTKPLCKITFAPKLLYFFNNGSRVRLWSEVNEES